MAIIIHRNRRCEGATHKPLSTCMPSFIDCHAFPRSVNNILDIGRFSSGFNSISISLRFFIQESIFTHNFSLDDCWFTYGNISRNFRLFGLWKHRESFVDAEKMHENCAEVLSRSTWAKNSSSTNCNLPVNYSRGNEFMHLEGQLSIDNVLRYRSSSI